MRRGVVVVGLLALAACVKIAPFASQDGPGSGSGDGGANACDPSTTIVATHVDGTQRVVCGPHYALRFSDLGFRFPMSFVVAGHELLARGATCADETAMGIGFYPAGIIDGDDPVAPEMLLQATSTVEIDSPFLIRIGLDWLAKVGSCATPIHGRTSFSFFADGRIARMDLVQRDDATSLGAGTCATTCTPTQPSWHVSTYTSFARPGAILAHGTVPGLDQSFILQDNENCVSGNGGFVGIGWSSDPGGKRIHTNATDAMALVFDVETPAQLGSFQDITRTTYLVSTTACDEATMVAYDSQSIQLNIGMPSQLPQTTIEVARDGIYGGSPDPADAGVILANDAVELSLRSGDPPIAAGFAVWLQFSKGYSNFSISKTGSAVTSLVTTAPQFHARPEDPRQVLFWFPEALAGTQKILITGTP